MPGRQNGVEGTAGLAAFNPSPVQDITDGGGSVASLPALVALGARAGADHQDRTAMTAAVLELMKKSD